VFAGHQTVSVRLKSDDSRPPWETADEPSEGERRRS
jgi:hypothetical protein